MSVAAVVASQLPDAEASVNRPAGERTAAEQASVAATATGATPPGSQSAMARRLYDVLGRKSGDRFFGRTTRTSRTHIPGAVVTTP